MDIEPTEISSSQNSIRFKVGDIKKLIRIELPCLVKSNETAISTLGGINSLYGRLQTFTDDTKFTFQLPNAIPLKSNIIGGVWSRHGVVVKIRRKKSDKSDVKYIVEGVCLKSVIFNNPADYQVRF